MSKILVVDDDQDACEVLLRALSAAGHDVYCAPNGREALSKIIDTPPDLVILDLLMPEMDGPNLLEVIRSYLRFHALPVILWTALPEDSPLVERGRSRKVNAILVKGKATIGDLVDTVQRHLAGLPT